MSLLAQLADITTYTTTSTVTDADAAMAVGAFLLFMIPLLLVAYAVSAFLLSRIFNKAGENAWKAWVPVYSNWVFLEIGGQKGFWAILAFIPILNIVALVFTLIAAVNIGKSLGKEGWFVLLYFFVTIVWLIWLAFDDSKWNGQPAVAGAGETPVAQPPIQPIEQNNTPPTPPLVQ